MLYTSRPPPNKLFKIVIFASVSCERFEAEKLKIDKRSCSWIINNAYPNHPTLRRFYVGRGLKKGEYIFSLTRIFLSSICDLLWPLLLDLMKMQIAQIGWENEKSEKVFLLEYDASIIHKFLVHAIRKCFPHYGTEVFNSKSKGLCHEKDLNTLTNMYCTDNDVNKSRGRFSNFSMLLCMYKKNVKSLPE